MISLVDYIGHTDDQGKPMGHPIKVISEMGALLKKMDQIEVVVPSTHAEEIESSVTPNIRKLKYSICAFSKERLKCFIKKMKNLNAIYQTCEDRVLFVNIDFSLFLYLFLFKKKIKAKTWVTLCFNPYKNLKGLKKYIVEKAMTAVELVIVTNKNLENCIPGKKIFIPDYYYKESLYNQFIGCNKEERIVCLGTMGLSKKLEELVDVCVNIDVPLKIVGNFGAYPERYAKLKSASCGSKVSVTNKYVGNNEYYTLIAESKYVILPYDMTLYDERTSGILLEAAFLNSVPIAPRKLLEYNGIEGVGYEEINEITKMLDSANIADILEKNKKIVVENFSEQSVLEKLKQVI